MKIKVKEIGGKKNCGKYDVAYADIFDVDGRKVTCYEGMVARIDDEVYNDNDPAQRDFVSQFTAIMYDVPKYSVGEVIER